MQMRVVGLPLLETIIKRSQGAHPARSLRRAEAADGAPFRRPPALALAKYPTVYLKLTTGRSSNR